MQSRASRENESLEIPGRVLAQGEVGVGHWFGNNLKIDGFAPPQVWEKLAVG